MAIVAYMRVSTEDQNTNSQELVLRRYASLNELKIDEVVNETVSSRKEERLIYKLIEQLEPSSILLVTKLDRLGRGTYDVLNIIESLKSKNIKLIVVEDNIVVDADNTSAIAKMTLTILSAFSQLERDFISERTKSSLNALKAKGVKLGRKHGAIVASKYDKYLEDIKTQRKLGVSLNQIIRNIKIGTVASLSAYVKSRSL